MIAAAMGGKEFKWPAGVYVDTPKYNHILMAMETVINKDGVTYSIPKGTMDEEKELDLSYQHLCKLRDEVIAMGVLPPVDKWHEINNNIK